MSLNQHNVQRLGWAYEATYGTSPITSGAVPYYEFGKKFRLGGNFPNKTYEVKSEYRGTRDPRGSIYGVKANAAISSPVHNGLPFYWGYGSSSTVTGVHTIDGIDSGQLPSLTIRAQSENSGDATATHRFRKEMLGSKLRSFSFEGSDLNKNEIAPFYYGLGFQGQDVQPAVHDADYAPVFPDSQNDIYAKNSSFVAAWDVLGDNVSIANDLVDFRYIMDSTNRFAPLYNQLLVDGIYEGTRAHILQMVLLRGGDTAIYDDYMAQTRTSTGKQFNMRVYALAGTNYIDLTLNNVLILDVVENMPYLEPDTYQVSALAFQSDSLDPAVPAIKDGLTAATFYGE